MSITAGRPSGYHRYQNEWDKCIILPKDELEAMVLKAQQGCSKSLDAVVKSCTQLVIPVAKYYYKYKRGRTLDILDYIQAGNEGLITAVYKCRFDKGGTFISYAVWYIRAGVMKCFSEMDFIKTNSVNKKDEEGERPTPIPVLLLEDILPQKIVIDEKETYFDITASEETADHIVRLDYRKDFDSLLTCLNERQRAVIKLRYFNEMEVCDIAEQFGLSSARIWQMLHKAIEKLREESLLLQRLREERLFINQTINERNWDELLDEAKQIVINAKANAERKSLRELEMANLKKEEAKYKHLNLAEKIAFGIEDAEVMRNRERIKRERKWEEAENKRLSFVTGKRQKDDEKYLYKDKRDPIKPIDIISALPEKSPARIKYDQKILDRDKLRNEQARIKEEEKWNEMESKRLQAVAEKQEPTTKTVWANMFPNNTVNPMDVNAVARKALLAYAKENNIGVTKIAIKIAYDVKSKQLEYYLYVDGQQIEKLQFSRDILKQQKKDKYRRKELLNSIMLSGFQGKAPFFHTFAKEFQRDWKEIAIFVTTVNEETASPVFLLYDDYRFLRQLFLEKGFV